MSLEDKFFYSPRLSFHFDGDKDIPKPMSAHTGVSVFGDLKTIPNSRGTDGKQLHTRLNMSDNSINIISSRYLQRDDDGVITETPEDAFMRVAKALAEVEFKYGATFEEVDFLTGQFYDIMLNSEFVPGGRTMANAGAQTQITPNCVVLHFEDDLKSIMKTLTHATLLQQLGSGIGFAFHLLRPAGLQTKRTKGSASGPCSFLMMYNGVFNIIQQMNRHGNTIICVVCNMSNIYHKVQIWL